MQKASGGKPPFVYVDNKFRLCFNYSEGIILVMKLIRKNLSFGFTLVELLLVIALISILAGVLFVVIDPVEQVKKTNDVATKNAAREFLAANTRYYMARNAFPWFSAANGGAACYSPASVPTYTLATVSLGNLATCIQNLISTGETKQSFSSPSTSSTIYITNPSPITSNAADNVACFIPLSKSQQNDPNTKYSSDGSLYAVSGQNCISKGGTINCYLCIQ